MNGIIVWTSRKKTAGPDGQRKALGKTVINSGLSESFFSYYVSEDHSLNIPPRTPNQVRKTALKT